MQLVQHNGVSSAKIKHCAFLFFPGAQNVTKCRYFDPFNYITDL